MRSFDRAGARLDESRRSADDALWPRDGVRFALGTAQHDRSHTDDPLDCPHTADRHAGRTNRLRLDGPATLSTAMTAWFATISNQTG